jgi:hypothetical protein
MSLQIFIWPGDNEIPNRAKLDDLRRIFAGNIESEHEKYLSLGFCDIFFGFDESRPDCILDMMLSRTPATPALWQGVWELMQNFDYWLFWQDCTRPLIGNDSIVISPETLEACEIGDPLRVQGADEIVEQIETQGEDVE